MRLYNFKTCRSSLQALSLFELVPEKNLILLPARFIEKDSLQYFLTI